ncbi:MAG: helix-turn-helix domain-containing protein [Chloroflexi bacterium]|nr:helix-turn-helix domain-containing protein [Chloroflexota bacterium]MBV9596662.1 helix-turn-helix domain-containing protein [Chloroflexota bacterium]
MSTTNLVQQVEQVCVDVARAGQDITFATVAARTGLSRSTLYRHPELRV